MFQNILQTSFGSKNFDSIDKGINNPSAFNVKDACVEISYSWFEVTAKTIENCWKKTGFQQNV